MALQGLTCFPTVPHPPPRPQNKGRGEPSAPATNAILITTCDAARSGERSPLAGRLQAEARRAKPERKVWRASQGNYNPSLPCACTPRAKEEGVWVRTTTPSTPRDVSPFLSKRAGKEGQKNGGLLVSVLRKAGKANYTSRLAARGCACALIPVAILPLLRHSKQTQFLVSPSLGGGAF